MIAAIHDMIVLDELVIIGTGFGKYRSIYKRFKFGYSPNVILHPPKSHHLRGKGPCPLDTVHSFWAVLVPGLSDNALVTSFFVC